jgi:hypothetical protein
LWGDHLGSWDVIKADHSFAGVLVGSVSVENREKRTLKKIIFLCGDSVTQNSRKNVAAENQPTTT